MFADSAAPSMEARRLAAGEAPRLYRIQRLTFPEVAEFIRTHHYARGMANNTTAAWGLFTRSLEGQGELLIGAISFNTPCSENVRASVFGPDHRARVTELHRLCLLDVTPRNTESWFVAEALRLLKEARPDLWAVVSFADSTAGHVGTIYQATNAYYYGTSAPETFFLDGDGRLRHPRQCGVNITREEAARRGWQAVRRGAKHRYLLLCPDDRRHERYLREMLRPVQVRPYPKLDYTYSVGTAEASVAASSSISSASIAR